jgi:class 3 adenylate cyclase/tetratricopeptide (TPR) repeat protein
MQAGERKLATILFADLAGSTALASEQDPESTRARLERFYDAMAAEVERAGGTVEKFAGDAVMAAFGAPAALEDHAERALHAALAMGRRLDELFGGELRLRVGVNTGEVVAGAARAGSSFVSGDGVNVGKRLEEGAVAGEILVGERTVAAVEGAFEFGAVRTVEAKGKPDGVAARPLLRALSLMRRRGFGGLDQVFVGREPELSALRCAYDRALETSSAQFVMLVGDAGAGKTTLVRELWHWLATCEPEPLRRAGRCLAYGRAVTYWPLAEILREQYALAEDETPDDVLGRLGSKRILGLTLGLDVAGELHPLAARDALQEAWVEQFEELAADRPVVALVEDVHWAEEPLLALLDRLRDDVRGPLLIVCTARPELLERRGVWERDAVHLEPLPPAETRDLVDRLLGGSAPAWVGALVAERAEGNPFFAEELVRTLIDQGLLRRDADGWQGEEPAGLALPDSVRALVAARVDLLGEDDKAAAQAAAVIGRTFWSSPVYELLGGREPDLRRLEERDFVRRRAGSTFPGEREYVFKHALVREVAYESVPRAARARLHAAFAHWLERRGESGDAHAALLAHHYAEAVRPDDVELAWGGEVEQLTSLRERAVTWLGRAAELAIRRYELDDGAELLRRALELAPDDPELWRRLGSAAALRFDGAGFCAAMERALDLEEDPLRQAEIYAELAFHSGIRMGMWRTRPDRERAAAWLEQALARTPPGSRLRALALTAQAFWEPHGSLDVAREAVSLSEQVADTELQAYAAGAHSYASLENLRFDEAVTWAERRLELMRTITDPDQSVDAYETAIAAITAQARLGEARELARRHVALTDRLSPHHQLHGVAVTVDVDELAGEWQRIASVSDRAEEAVARNADTPCVRNRRVLLVCSLAAAQLGEHERSRALEAAGDALEIDDFAGWLSEPKLRLALLRGDLDAAAVLADEQLRFRAALGPAPLAAYLDALGALRLRDRAEKTAALVRGSAYLEPFALRALGLVREDEKLLDEATARFDALGLGWHAGETRRLLGART